MGPHAEEWGEKWIRGRVEECEREEGVGEGSSTFSQLSLTYMERADNNKCLCVRALKAAQLLRAHNGHLPTSGPSLAWPALAYKHQLSFFSQNYILLTFFIFFCWKKRGKYFGQMIQIVK